MVAHHEVDISLSCHPIIEFVAHLLSDEGVVLLFADDVPVEFVCFPITDFHVVRTVITAGLPFLTEETVPRFLA